MRPVETAHFVRFEQTTNVVFWANAEPLIPRRKGHVLPARITIDEHGYVVSVESLPALKSRLEPSGKTPRSKAGRVSSAKKPKGRKATTAPKPLKRSPHGTRLQAGSEWILCPVCGVRLLEKNLRKHQRKTHAIYAASPSPVTRATASTPAPRKNKNPEVLPSNSQKDWKRKVALLKDKARRLDREIETIKSTGSSEGTARIKALRAERAEALKWSEFCAKRARESTPTKKAKGKKTKKLLSPSTGGKRDRTGKRLGVSGQALHQSFEDSSYAGRGLGHMRREQGRFGSLPLYDDYGEESGAD